MRPIRTSPFFTRSLLFLAILLFPPSAFAQRRPRPPEAPIAFASPSSIVRGSPAILTFTSPGVGLGSSIWTSFPSKNRRVYFNDERDLFPDRARYEFDLPANTPVGPHAVRLSTGAGVSSLQMIFVDQLPTYQETPGNKSRATAQPVLIPSGVEGAVEELPHDHFRFFAEAGQRISVEVVAQRIGSRLDPIVRLLDAGGRELAYCDDDPAVGADSRISVAIPATGDYFIEVRDTAYAGGPAHRYRLRVGDFDLPVTALPLGIQRGSETEIRVLGGHRDIPPRMLTVPKDASAARAEADGASVRLIVSDLEERIESEPNDKPDDATAFPFRTSAISGTFDKPKDKDHYRVDGIKGQTIAFRARSRSAGSPCDVTLRMLNPEGKQLAASDPAAADEGTLSFKFPEDGPYTLVVSELNRRSGPTLAYRIEAAADPGFQLSVDLDKVDTTLGGTFEIKVTAVRKGYTGPITLALPELPETFILSDNTIPEGKTEATLKVKVPPDARLGHPWHFTLAGYRAKEVNAGSATASTAPALRRIVPSLLYPPFEWDGLIGLGIRATQPASAQAD